MKSATQLAGLEVGHAVGPPMSAALSGLTVLGMLPGHEVSHAAGPPMLATLPGLTMLATLSGHEVGHAAGPPMLATLPGFTMLATQLAGLLSPRPCCQASESVGGVSSQSVASLLL